MYSVNVCLSYHALNSLAVILSSVYTLQFSSEPCLTFYDELLQIFIAYIAVIVSIRADCSCDCIVLYSILLYIDIYIALLTV